MVSVGVGGGRVSKQCSSGLTAAQESSHSGSSPPRKVHTSKQKQQPQNHIVTQRISVLHCSLDTKHKVDLLTRQEEVISLISAILSPDEEVAAHKVESFVLPLCGPLSC